MVAQSPPPHNIWRGARTQGKFNTHKFSARGKEISPEVGVEVVETGKIDRHLPELPGNGDFKVRSLLGVVRAGEIGNWFSDL